MERRTADVIKAVTNVDLQYEESEVEVEMVFCGGLYSGI